MRKVHYFWLFLPLFLCYTLAKGQENTIAFNTESKITKDTVSLVKFNSDETHIKLIEFMVYQDLESLADRIKGIIHPDTKCERIYLTFEITKPNSVALIGYKSSCEFMENDMLDFLQRNVHLKLISCEMEQDTTQLTIPVNLFKQQE